MNLNCLKKCSFIELQTRWFDFLGRSIGRNPFYYLIASLLITTFCLIGLKDLYLKDDVRFGYSKAGSYSVRERKVFREFIGVGGPLYATTIVGKLIKILVNIF